MKHRNINKVKRVFLLLIGCTGWWLSDAVAQTIPGDTVFIQLSLKDAKVSNVSDSVKLDEVVVKARKTPLANSRWSDLHPVDLLTTGGANGDLYKALQTLPGTQAQGESGRLLVRGGSSEETQTFIDGMHVLNPYTSTGNNTPARGRYSTFMFSGINLSSGGAPLEYGEALSAVLPLDTKDESRINKTGVNLSTVGVGGGGTRAFNKGSLSTNLEYQDLTTYNKIYPGRYHFKDPYRMMTGAAQFRYHPGEHSLLKVYTEYDRTDFSNYQEDDGRLFDLSEDNIYLNATYRNTGSGGWKWFSGMAYSYYNRGIGGAVMRGDSWNERQQELHLKAKASRRVSSLLHLEMGVESFVRQYKDRYAVKSGLQPVTGTGDADSIEIDSRHAIHPVIVAGFFSATYYPLENLKAELSLRPEYTSNNHQMTFSPRVALNYYWDNIVFSATAGRYTQLPQNKYLVLNAKLKSEACLQYNLGAQYRYAGRVYKAEFYYKKYTHLALFDEINTEELLNSGSDGQSELLKREYSGDIGRLASTGYGHSKGIDLFFDDRASFSHLEYQVSYTYNISKRKYAEYNELTTPQYATRHNASLVLKYTIPRWGTIIGLTNRFSSGRPYHNPLRAGLMNDEVKPYNSLDLGLTFLPSRKVIIHASASNILCRKNEFGRVDNKSVLATSDHFFYIGVYITLGKKAAYDVSNF